MEALKASYYALNNWRTRVIFIQTYGGGNSPALILANAAPGKINMLKVITKRKQDKRRGQALYKNLLKDRLLTKTARN